MSDERATDLDRPDEVEVPIDEVVPFTEGADAHPCPACSGSGTDAQGDTCPECDATGVLVFTRGG